MTVGEDGEVMMRANHGDVAFGAGGGREGGVELRRRHLPDEVVAEVNLLDDGVSAVRRCAADMLIRKCPLDSSLTGFDQDSAEIPDRKPKERCRSDRPRSVPTVTCRCRAKLIASRSSTPALRSHARRRGGCDGSAYCAAGRAPVVKVKSASSKEVPSANWITPRMW